MKKILLSLTILAMGVIITGCKKPEVEAVIPAPTVEVMKVNAAVVPLQFSYIGKSVGSEAVEVRAQVSGILTSRNYNEGDYVNEGQVLFNIEPVTYRAVANQAKAKLTQAEAKYVQSKQNFDRVNDLYSMNAVSQLEYDTSKADYDVAAAEVSSAKAALQDANVKLRYTAVTAPISGYASKENFTIGNLISANSMDSNLLTVINKLDPIYVNISIPESDYKLVRRWKDDGKLDDSNIYATVTLNDGTNYIQKGKIIFTDKQINQSTGSVAVKIEFQNESSIILPGEYLKVNIVGYKLINTVTIPQRSILQSKDDKMVIVVGDDNIAKFSKVDLGETIGNLFVVKSGVNVGDRIVIEGTNKVRNGSEVIIYTPEKVDDNTPAIKG